MRDLKLLDSLRDVGSELELMGMVAGTTEGIFHVPSESDKRPMRVIASSGHGWDHVSVSRSDRCPTWAEMEQVKRRFFKDDETAMQLHVPPSEHVNNYLFCLHLWRPQHETVPRPSASLV